MGTFVFFLIVFFVIIYLYFSNRSKGSRGTVENRNGLDTQNLPPNFSQEEKAHFLQIAAFCGKRYITQADARAYTTHRIWKDLSAMPGWCNWSLSVHEASGQYERMERGLTSEALMVLCYDPKYQLAKVQGRTGIYLTSCNRCSCPDFRKRHLPCKHMYLLGIWLEGDVNRQLIDTMHKPLYGLTFALIGHLPKKTKNTEGIRSDIESLGGSWSESINIYTSASVVGTALSEARLSQAKEFDMECLGPECLKEVFAPTQ